MPNKFRKKPHCVDEVAAEQFWPDKKPWPEGVIPSECLEHDVMDCPTCMEAQIVSHGFFTCFSPVLPGDWIVKDDRGGVSVITQRWFERIYEPVEGS